MYYISQYDTVCASCACAVVLDRRQMVITLAYTAVVVSVCSARMGAAVTIRVSRISVFSICVVVIRNGVSYAVAFQPTLIVQYV
jgi:hypothetical protein